MKTKFIVGTVLLSAVIIINSCENKQSALPVLPCTVDTTKLAYASDSNTMQPIINEQCGVNNNNPSCHGPYGTASNDGYNFTTYSGIFAQYQNGNLSAALFGDGSKVPQMPLIPQPGWSACVLAKFKAWTDQGCPQ
jgi:hypothetical protein